MFMGMLKLALESKPEVNERSRAFIFRNDTEFLVLVRNFRSKVGREWPVLLLPGGGIDPGENAEEAVIREIGEEVGIAITDISLAYTFSGTRKADELDKAYSGHNGDINNHFYFYKAKVGKNAKPVILEEEKFDAIAWVTKESIHAFAKKYHCNKLGDGIEEALKYI
jgi:8-oxo-dGTP pyrophosphatase MutT (NUDIX family)